ncbi:hypothetical protein [Ascidiimonas sp. W6]|uniref:hypothetical protein n=1 Tax=Ascidiimonas meishanensis TaxID=3128903 RepID=UPI0030EDD063
MIQLIKIGLIIVLSFWMNPFNAQVLEMENIQQFILADGTHIKIAKKRSGFDETEEAYYYLPAKIDFSKSKQGAPEFSFLAYKQGGEITGGILHFLVQWGLDKNQLYEADSLLKAKQGTKAILMGAVMPEASVPAKNIRVEGNLQMAQILNNSKSTKGKVTLLPHSKMASSFHLSRADAISFQKLLSDNNNLKNTFLVFDFQLKFKEANKTGITITPYIIKENFKELLNQ